MVGLLTEMWIYLVLAALIGLGLGWGVRGAFLPQPKTVSVTPSVSETSNELTKVQKEALARAEQAGAAIKTLEARVKSAQEAAATYQSDLATVNRQLANVKAELETAKASATQGGGAPAEPAMPAQPPEDKARAEWHSRYLESRVRHLEGLLASATPEPAEETVEKDTLSAELADTKSRLVEAEAGMTEAAALKEDLTRLQETRDELQVQFETASTERDALKARLADAEAMTTESGDGPAVNPVELSKLQWQNRYLQARATYLEENAASAASPAEAAKGADLVTNANHEVDTLQSELTVLKAELSRVTEADSEAEKELARLRWRNRYLEGRVKYLEAASLDAESDADDTNDSVAAALDQITRSVEVEPPQDIVITDAPGIVPADMPPQEAEIAQYTPPEPAAEISDEPVEETRPESLDAPRNGTPDDLKRIGGIGPKIQGILNELGIFHFDQIANWTAGEEAWVDSYLRFQGRVQREKWVDQAKSLWTASQS